MIPSFLRSDSTKQAVRRLGLAPLARTVHERVDPDRRRLARRNDDLLAREHARLSPIAEAIAAAGGSASGVGLIVSYDQAPYVLMQLPVLTGMAAAGIEPVAMLPSQGSRVARRLYEACGVRRFAAWDDRADTTGKRDMLRQLADCRTQDDVLALTWRGIRVGKYAVSTLMRRRRQGHIDPRDPGAQADLAVLLDQTLDHTAAAIAMVERWKPEVVALVDRGYTPEGPLFDVCVAHGIQPITFNAAHRDNTLMLKRYGPTNRDVHPASLSDETWARQTARPWGPEDWERVKAELEFCYRSGQWYGEVGTQFRARLAAGEALRADLGLDPTRRTVLLFPHIFWDATFFWGEDLYADYEAWFRAAAAAALENDSVNWVIKLHPANLVKNHRDGIESFSESDVLREFGAVPNHVKILPADTDVSTLSLFAVGDICLTVRGTVGVEAAALGLRVITAGTGRYDGLGFTLDPRSVPEYEATLARLDSLPMPTEHEIELARRYADGMLLQRPLHLSSIRFGYDRDAGATLRIDLAEDHAARPLDAPDVRAIADWLRSGAQDFTVGPETAPPAASGGDA
ncbi:hypothetical protein [Roseospira navarrensis]|uniref:hypothetical protein n=1 Tax=Roseospira navarrensis TaxID=140058 RepID=UPI0014784914|nr:hypothetical protein [Roseospira navarrensis]